MKLLLVRPDHPDEGMSNRKLGIIHQPLGLLYLAAMLEQHGHEVLICDEMVGDSFYRSLKLSQPDMVGITVTTLLFQRVKELVLLSHEQKVPVILGGPHVCALPEESLLESGADGVILGEGEESFSEVADGKQWSDIQGLVFLNQEGTLINNGYPHPPEIDHLPFPARHLLDRRKYLGEHEVGFFIGKRNNLIRIFTSRGCPHRCTFCSSATIFGRKARYRNPESIISEIEKDTTAWNTRNVMFMDDTFTLKRQHVIDVCNALLKTGKKIRWGCFSRAGVPEDVLTLMRDAGCHLIGFGVESGSPRILERLKKNITISAVEESLAMCRKLGIRSKAFIMLGVPGETEEDFQMTVDLCLRARPDYLTVSIFAPLPGSEIMADLSESDKRLLTGNYYRSTDPVLRKRQNELLRRFHFRFSYARNFFRNFSINEIPDYIHMMKAFISLQRNI